MKKRIMEKRHIRRGPMSRFHLDLINNSCNAIYTFPGKPLV